MKPAPGSPRDPIWLTLAVALAALAIQVPIFDRWFALLDEGYILQIADDVNRGHVLYRDINVDAPFPGAFYLLAWWFRIAGTSILTSRALVVTGFAVFAAATFRICRTLLPRSWSFAVLALIFCYRIWAFPHWHIYSYSMVSATLLSVAIALLGVFLASGRRALVAAAGVAAGCAVMCKQDYGLAVSGLATIVLAVVGFTERAHGPARGAALAPAATFVAGGAAIVLPALGYFAWEGALGDLVRQAFLVPLSGALAFSYPRMPSLTPFFTQDPELRAGIGNYFPSILATLWWDTIGTGHLYKQTAVWDVTLKLTFYAPIVVGVIAVVLWTAGFVRRLRRGAEEAARREDAYRLLLLAWACGFLLAFNRPRDWVHLMMIYPPALVVGAVLLEQLSRRLPRPARLLLDVVAAVPVLVLGVLSVALAIDLRRTMDYQLATPRGGVRIDARNGPIIDDLLAYVASDVPAGEPLPVYPVQPMLTFLAGREAAGGFHVIWPVQDPARDEKIVADLERRRPSTIVYSLSQYAHLGSFQNNAARLYTYLVDNYQIRQVLSRETHGPLITLLARRSAAAVGSSLLGQLPGGGALTAERWPFAHLMSQPVTLDTAPAPAFVQVHVPEGGATLTTAFGINPDRWLSLKSGPFRFAVAVLTTRAEGDRGSRKLVLEERIDPAHAVDDRKWFPVDIDLDRFAGQDVLLAFSVSTANLLDEPDGLAGWADPRLVPKIREAPARGAS